MSAAGLREKHLRAMTALEDVVQQNQEMKKQLALLTVSSESDERHSRLSAEIVLLNQEKEDLRVRLDEAVAQCKKLSSDLNAEMIASDRERKYVRVNRIFKNNNKRPQQQYARLLLLRWRRRRQLWFYPAME